MGGPSDTRDGAINLDCFTFPEVDAVVKDEIISDRTKLAYAMATIKSSDRNRLTSILIKHSDDVCTAELGRLTANEATTNASLSILSTGFSAAATVVGGELAKSILSGTATVLGASRDHINVHVYRNTIAQAVSQVIASERKKISDAIYSKYSDDKSIWSIDDAIRQVNVYHSQCSFFKGLELLLKAADNNTDLQAYRSARAQQVTLTRIDDEISRLQGMLRLVNDDDQASREEVTKKIVDLSLTRASIGLKTNDPVSESENIETPPLSDKM